MDETWEYRYRQGRLARTKNKPLTSNGCKIEEECEEANQHYGMSEEPGSNSLSNSLRTSPKFSLPRLGRLSEFLSPEVLSLMQFMWGETETKLSRTQLSPSISLLKESRVKGTTKLATMSEDASVLYRHFPQYIWLLITDKVTDFNDLTNLMKASPVFEILLLAQRAELFPPLMQSFWGETETGQSRNELSSSISLINENRVNETVKLATKSEDESILCSPLPIEIWELITKYVTDFTALTNLMDASPMFKNILFPRRTQFLFPQVWKVLGVKFEKREDEVYSYNTNEMYTNLDRALSRFQNKNTHWCSRILKLRLVCKSWCQGVDEFYQNLPVNKHYKMTQDRKNEMGDGYMEIRELHSNGRGMGDWTQNVMFVGSNERVSRFIEHFDPTHFAGGRYERNPIISRHIRIIYRNGHRSTGILNLLSKYGHHFWFCTLNLTDDFKTRVACYSELKEILELLPNLKALNVTYRGLHKDVRQNNETFPRNGYHLQRKICQLDREIQSHPLSKLSQLKFLSVKNFPTFLFQALVSSNSHISMLEVQHDDQTGYNFRTISMPKLKQLSMRFFSKLEFENLFHNYINWHLEKIYLNFKTCSLMPLMEIFTLLENKWAATLKDVAIYFPPANSGSLYANAKQDGSTMTLNLSKVQRFKLTSREIFNLDFILPMTSLEFLEIAVPKICENSENIKKLRLVQKSQVIQFVGFFHNFDKSNIWNLFPKLKSFQVGDVDKESTTSQAIYTRQDYESKGKTSKPITRSEANSLWLF